jgi:hypothetical protein
MRHVHSLLRLSFFKRQKERAVHLSALWVYGYYYGTANSLPPRGGIQMSENRIASK